MVEEAQRKARGIRTTIPEEVSSIETEYISELEKYEEKNLSKLQSELDSLETKLQGTLCDRKKELDSRASVLEPRALELIRNAVEGEGG